MKKSIVYGIVIFLSLKAFAQPNCEMYLAAEDSSCYLGCKTLLKAISHPQGSQASQKLFDTAIQYCPGLAYAYAEKAVPYLKRGDFITWKRLIDQAVEIDPAGYLGYRGWCRYQFLRDYEGAIQDFDALDTLNMYDPGYSANGDYHLDIAKALCYKGLGKYTIAARLIENKLAQATYDPGPYDYLHLGVIYINLNRKREAIKALEKQKEINPYISEGYFYLGIIYAEATPKKALVQFKIAHRKYVEGYKLNDPYTAPMDKIYLNEIVNAIKSLE